MLTKKTLIPFLFTIIILSSYSSILTTRRVEAATAYPVVSITPAISSGDVGENLNVSIIIQNAVGLFGYQVYIDYSPTLLSVVNITEGDLLRRGGAYTTFWRAVYNDTKGLAQVVNTLLLGEEPVTGDGEAFIITFKLDSAGGSKLLLHDVLLMNQFATLIVPVFTQNATVSTARLGVTPSLIRPNAANDYSINKTFNVNLTLAGAVSELYKYDLTVTYGKDVLQATSVTLLPFMGTPNTNLTHIDIDNGTVKLSVECTPPASPTNETGTLATITFQVIGLGGTSIEISANSTLTNRNGEGIFPLIAPASFNNQYADRNIGIVSSTLSTYEVTAGDNITETILVKNDGSTNETCEVLVHAQNNITALLTDPTTFNIDANTTESINVTLKTFGLEGNFTVNIFLYYLPEETTYQDNGYTIVQQLLIHAAPEESPPAYSTSFYVGVAVIVILIAVVAAYILARRRKAS